MLGGAGHLSLEGGEVGGDAVDVEGDNGLLAFWAEEEGAVGVGVHEEVFGEDSGGRGVAEDVEVGFEVGVGVGVVGAEALAGEVGLGGGVGMVLYVDEVIEDIQKKIFFRKKALRKS